MPAPAKFVRMRPAAILSRGNSFIAPRPERHHTWRMNPQFLIEDVANRADDFLRGVTNPSEAHNAIVELLAIEQPSLAAEARRQIADAVMEILRNEDFFNMATASSSGGWSDDDADDEAE